MKNSMQRIVSFVLAFVLMIGLVPAIQVEATDTVPAKQQSEELAGKIIPAELPVSPAKGNTGITVPDPVVHPTETGSVTGHAVGLRAEDSKNAVVQLYDTVNSYTSSVAADGSYRFDGVTVGKYFLKIETEGYQVPKPATVTVTAKQETVQNLTVTRVEDSDFFYNWKADDTYFGYEEAATVPTDKTVQFLNETVYMADSNAAEKLYRDYHIILSNEDLPWSMDYASKMAELIGEIHDFPGYTPSKWVLTKSEIDDDIDITYGQDANIIRINKRAFENAIPRKATVNGLKGTYFSNRLYHALIRYATKEGTDIWFIDNLLKHDYGCSIIVPDYEALTRGITNDTAAAFQQFKPEELLAILEMYAEMPKGFHKVENLEYLIRRLDGHLHPIYPEAAAVSWPTVEHGYIEFMESAFRGSEVEDTFRLVLHEKSHFLWANVFSESLKKEWADIGGWYRTDADSDEWSTTKETEFVTAYAHAHNPDEDMAESIAYYVIMPDKLESRSPAKYAFIRDCIMNGEIYMSQIRDDLTFEVYNLYPDYNYPGRIVGVDVQVQGKPEEDKQLTVTVTLDTHGDKMYGATEAYMRLMSEKDPVTNTEVFYDMTLKPINADCSVLRGTMTMSKYTWNGYWYNEQITLTDLNGNQRFCGVDNFGWKLYLNNPLEDREIPQYVPGSLHVEQTKGEYEGNPVTYIHVKFKATDNVGFDMIGSVIDNIETDSYSYQMTEWYHGNGDDCELVFFFPEYMGTGKYLVARVYMRDMAQNRIYYNFNIDGTGSSPEKGTTFYFEGSNPDYEPPQLDVNNILVTAYPTHPEAPNGETVVYIDFYTKDNISGLEVANFRLLDPLGNTHFQWYYPDGYYRPFFPGDPTAWKHERICVILPEGSVPGKWGLLEIKLTDKAGNFRTFNFLEIVHFVVDKDSVDAFYNMTPISGEISVQDKVQLHADNMDPAKEYVWSVENGTGKATITENGILEAVSSGYVTVTVYEKYNPEKYGEMKVYIASDAHHFGPWEIETPATNEQPGVMIRKCLDKGCDYFEIKSIPVLNMKDTVTLTCFDTNGAVLSTVTQKYGTKPLAPVAPVKAGFRFGGWFADREGTTAFDFTKQIFKDTAVYAKWIPDHVKKVNIIGANMDLGNSLRMGFYVEKADLAANQTYYAVVTKEYADGRQPLVVKIEQKDWMYLAGPQYYGVIFNQICAKEMTDTITVQIFTSDGAMAGDVWVDSVRGYAMRGLDQQAPAVRTMLVDMMHYGAESQKFFDYHVNDLADSELTEAQKAYGTKTVVMEDHRVKGDTFYGSSLQLASNISLAMYFKNVTPDMYAVFTFTDHKGNDHTVRVEGNTFKKAGDGIYGAVLNALVIADARQMVTCTVYKADGTKVDSAIDSVESYAAGLQKTGGLYEAILKFGTSAHAYFHS